MGSPKTVHHWLTTGSSLRAAAGGAPARAPRHSAAHRAGARLRGRLRGDGKVTIDDLVTGVAIALGNAAVGTCAAIDVSGDGHVTVDELVRAVRSALSGCA